MPKALITGITGQDGSYLAEFLLGGGYEVIGMVRRTSTTNFDRIRDFQDRVTIVQGDLLDQVSLINLLQEHRPEEVYNLAARASCQQALRNRCLPVSLLRWRHPHSGCCSHRGPLDPFLPGVQFRDVRQGAGSATARDHAVLSAQPTAWPRSTATGSR